MTRWAALLVSVMLACAAAAPARAETCTAGDYAAAVDRSGAELRKASRESQPLIQERMRRYQAVKGLQDEDYESAAFDAIQDKELEDFDARSAELLLKIDSLGRIPDGKQPVCAELDDIEALSKELLGVMRAKSAHVLARLDAKIAEAGGAPAGKEAAAKETPAKAAGNDAGKKDEGGTAGKDAAAKPAPAKEPPPEKAPTAAKPSAPATAAPGNGSGGTDWQAETKHAAGAAKPNDAYVPPPQAAVPPEVSAGDGAASATAANADGYSIEEIQDATRGFFGTISTGLASVIEHAFKTSGRPTAYILGTEGGGAFLAGLRFGSGKLYMRASPETRKVWWHGPSIGGDFGADGTRTLFLIYKLDNQDALFRSFTGVDGSAFFVGGVGMTILKGGPVIMAPIRTGLGLRVGANIGYIRFTPQATWNPF